jgi:hypothetical protein
MELAYQKSTPRSNSNPAQAHPAKAVLLGARILILSIVFAQEPIPLLMIPL